MFGNFEKYCSDYTYQRFTPDTDEWGNPIPVWATVGTLKGVFKQLSKTSTFGSSIDAPLAKYRLYCLPTDIQEGDRIIHNGSEYTVLGVNDVMDMGKLYQVELKLYASQIHI